MKTLGRLKLNKFSEVELEEKKMRSIRGGDRIGSKCYCGCACNVAITKTIDNADANMAYESVAPEVNGSYTTNPNYGMCFEWDWNGKPTQITSR